MTLRFEIDVLSAIAKRNALAFVGSGASCEMGYPSWSALARQVLDRLVRDKHSEDYSSIERAIENGKYPEALGYIERITSRSELCNAMAEILKPGLSGSDNLYSILVKLPFSCYFTTNYDDELLSHLKNAGRTGFGVLGNSKEDFFSFRDDMRDIVFKIHGDFTAPYDAVITSKDYSAYTSAPEREYYRAKLKALFLMKRSVFVGYSLADRDLEIILETLKQQCSEIAPAFMFLPNTTKLDIEEYATRYGIKIIQYKVKDNDHSALVRKLETYYKFLSKTDERVSRVSDDSLHAAELYLFRVLNKGTNCLDLSNYLLMLIPSNNKAPISVVELTEQSKVRSASHINTALSELHKNGYVEKLSKGYVRTKAGNDRVVEAQASFATEKKLAFADFLSKLTITPDLVDKCFVLLQNCLSKIFAMRGDALVQSIFNQTADIAGGAKIDIYSVILPYAAELREDSYKTEFLHAVYDFIIKPTSHQKTYLVSMAQGYFLYHMMGHDSTETNLIREKLENTVWYVDSNLLIPLVALGCANHRYAVDLFEKLKGLGVKIIVVPLVLEEVRRHLKWALEHNPRIKNNYAAVTQGYSSQQNLFVDGYIRMTADGKVKSFEQYLGYVNSLLASNANRLLELYGILYESPRKVYNWDKTKFDELKQILELRRKKNASYRRVFQIETDAELLYSMKCRQEHNNENGINEEVCFLSQSTLFEEESDIIRTWSGEAMFRLVQFIMPVMSSEETLHECLQNELYNAGIQFIDEEKYGQFFQEQVDWAEMTFEQQKKEFCRILNEPDEDLLSRNFAELTDLQKPIFIRQMEEKSASFHKTVVADLRSKLDSSIRNVAGKESELAAKDAEIARLSALLKKRDASLTDANNRINNLYNGKAYQRLLKKVAKKSKKKK